MDNKWLRNSFVYLILLVAVVALFFTAFPPSGGNENQQISINEVAAGVKEGTIRRILVSDDRLQIEYLDKRRATSRKETNVGITQQLRDYGVTPDQLDAVSIVFVDPPQFGNWLQILINLLPLVFFGGILLFMMRQAQGTNNQALSFGKSRARMFMANKPTVTFADVAGVDEAKQELHEVVEFLKFPEKFAALGARIPKGVLLVGPPGTGKTLLSRAVAGEAGVPFFSISGSEFVEMFVGVGASRVRDLFEQAKRNSPCIIFVDEIDAVGRQRGAGLGGSHDEREQTLNQILVEMDGFDGNTNVIVTAATNRPDVLDPALLRPGRFDRHVVLPAPDIGGRRAILDVHARGKPLESSVDLGVLAKQTPGFSGADLANLINEGAIIAARRNKQTIGMAELEDAIDRVIAGPERKSRIISEEEKTRTAVHEAGHAVVARFLKNHDPVHKITIIAHGMMGGYTRFLPVEDRHLWTRSQFEDRLAGTLGGHCAEKLVYGEMSTGAQNDLEVATNLARKMICEYGMSDRLGPRTFGHKEEMIFLGREIGEQKNYSEKIAETIDEEIRRLIEHAHDEAMQILADNRHILDLLSEELIKRETLEGEALERVFSGLPVEDPLPVASPPSPPAAPAERPEKPLPKARPRLAPGSSMP
ncbi:MAG TPA: ATP-dependent zinc metalloprotease FtsH [Chloroflexota bacterium]|nr:ATP-dependent zinc metalloprotease FtsH [Chloroflexota bacterium]